MTSRVTRQVAEFCQKNALIESGDRIIVGVSGGPDSLCLLHLLVNLRAEFDLTLSVAHLNHQLRGRDAQADADFVTEIATGWQLPVRVEACDVGTLASHRKQSIEEAARQIRYAFLWRAAIEVGARKIAVGHNADDQVETILMHFLRGSGLAGLRGMLPQIEIARLRLNRADIPDQLTASSPTIIRPLLEISRQEIENYCQENRLSPRRDYTNEDTTYYRNRLRHELIPYLETYNPKFRQVLQNSARVVTADTEILNEHLEKAWRSVISQESLKKIEIDLHKWLDLPLAMKRSTLRRAVHSLRRSLRDLNFEHVETAIGIIETGSTGAKATLPQGLLLTISYDTIIIAPEEIASSLSQVNLPHLATGEALPLRLPGETSLPHTNWQIKANLLFQADVRQEQLRATGRWEAYLDADVVGDNPMLRPRQPGDTFCPLGMNGHRKKVNEFMINEKIPVNQRDQIPLLVANQHVLWICGYRPDERARVVPTTGRIVHLKFEQL